MFGREDLCPVTAGALHVTLGRFAEWEDFPLS